MKQYFVTGVAGFIASRVSELLLRQGHAVHGIDNLSAYYNPLMKLRRLERLQKKYPNFSFVRGNIEEPLQLRAAAKDKYDAVIHLAARAGVRPSVQDPAAYMRTNLLGTLNVLDLCRDLQIEKIVNASSSSVYGSDNPTPFHEDFNTDSPLSPYAASKKAAEVLCSSYHHLYRLDISVLRFFTVYGPAGRPDMSMFRFVRAIVEREPLTVFGDGSQLRDFSYVDDIARGVIASLLPCGCRIFNLGADSPVRLSRVIELIELACGKEAVIRYEARDVSDAPATWAHVGRARSELGWTPEVPLEEGIRRTLTWYLDNREWANRMASPAAPFAVAARAAV
jgi:nucleoside-diphosphate-sugar epimerase